MDTNGQVAEQTQPKAQQLTREEMLELENYLLKISNIKLQGDKLQADLVRANEMLQDEQNRLRVFRDGMKHKYGVDLGTTKILQDGSFVTGVRG